MYLTDLSICPLLEIWNFFFGKKMSCILIFVAWLVNINFNRQ